MTPRRSLLLGIPTLLANAAQAGPTWPDRPIRLLVPFPPGGPTDLVARPLAARLGQALGQSVVVDNRGGAGGNLGADMVAKAPPDGYTLLLSNVGVLAINASLYRHLSYNPERDFAPVALIAGAPVALVVHTGVPARGVAEFIAWTRRQPAPVPYGTAGAGSPGHLAGELFRSLTGAALSHVPYRGSAPAVQDVAAGNIAVMFDPIQSVLPQVGAGRVRALAISAGRRSLALPNVPTMAEAGVPGHEMIAWWALVAPAGLPSDILARLAQTTTHIVQDADFGRALDVQGVSTMLRTGPELAAFLRAEAAKWGEAVRTSGASAE